MGFFSLQFQNQELEDKYQIQQQKYVKKSANYLLLILSIGEMMTTLDNIFNIQYVMMAFAFSLVMNNAIIYYLIKKKKIDAKIIIYYFNTMSIMSIFVQVIYIKFQDFFKFTDAQIFAQLDIIHQFVTLLNFGQSHLISSAIYILFIICRVYIQISYGFTSLSVSFSIFCLFYIFEQYQKAKQRRKQFLKSQRNKLLEQLIQDFIDEKVCIIEKDEDNVKFIPIIVNNKLQELSSDINQILKQLKLCNNKCGLEQYLYLTTKEKETLLCSYNFQTFQITYQKILLKTCQIFIKIQQIYHHQSSIINYKDLYHKQQNYIQKIEKMNYQTKIITNKLQIRLFVYWFNKYFLCYHIKQQLISIEQLKDLLIDSQFDIIYKDVELSGLKSDRLLLCLLFQSLKQCLSQRQIKLYQMKSGIQILIYGILEVNQKEQLISFINKILFHIGVGNVIFKYTKDRLGLITIKLLDIKNKKFQSINY
ncbi:hypothetical protein pb186bvf_014419 [Paramecium bursaria]